MDERIQFVLNLIQLSNLKGTDLLHRVQQDLRLNLYGADAIIKEAYAAKRAAEQAKDLDALKVSGLQDHLAAMNNLKSKKYEVFEKIKKRPILSFRDQNSKAYHNYYLLTGDISFALPIALNFWWYARDLAKVLGIKFEKFSKIIRRTKMACKNNEIDHDDYFFMTKVFLFGRFGREVIDYMLTPYDCYSILENCNPCKEIITLGQTYFLSYFNTMDYQKHEDRNYVEEKKMRFEIVY